MASSVYVTRSELTGNKKEEIKHVRSHVWFWWFWRKDHTCYFGRGIGMHKKAMANAVGRGESKFVRVNSYHESVHRGKGSWPFFPPVRVVWNSLFGW